MIADNTVHVDTLACRLVLLEMKGSAQFLADPP
jgi:hypothetical protein